MDPMILFLACGFVAMSAALSAGALNKLPEEKRTGFMTSRNGALYVVMVGNFAALTLIGAMAYGFRHLHWAVPLSCLLVSFPLLHMVVLQRLLGDQKNIVLMTLPIIAAVVALYIYW
ncbi:MAG: hypothetical protein ACPG4U_07120 [Pseudomonadales bacterium]